MAGLDLELYGPPNPAVTQILNSSQMRAICQAEAERAKGIYVSIVARGTEDRTDGDPHLYESAHAGTERVTDIYGSRWAGVMEVDNPHVLPHNLGWTTEDDREVPGEYELNHVLELL